MTRKIDKQPAALYPLCLTILSERFAYYTMRAVIVLYMVKQLLFTNNHAYALFGVFTSILYLMPPIGGYLADKVLGTSRAILIGALGLAVGYILLAMPGVSGFYLGLSCVIVSSGFFMPNIANAVGAIYDEHDARREGGFSIYYTAINIGAFIPPLFIAFVIMAFGWHAAFVISAVTVLIGAINYAIYCKRFHKNLKREAVQTVAPQKVIMLVVCMVLAIIVLSKLIVLTKLMYALLIVLGSILVLLTLKQCMGFSKQERVRLFAVLLLILFSIVFWALYQQGAMSVTIFTNYNVDRHFFHWTLPTEMFQATGPLSIVILGPVLAKVWTYLERHNINPSVAKKFAFGCTFMGLAYVLLAVATIFAGKTGRINFDWIIVSYILQTIGELFLSPIGLSMVTELSPPTIVGLMMGIWYFATAVANAVAGIVAQFSTVASGSNNPLDTNSAYMHVFGGLGISAVVVGLIIYLLAPRLTRAMYPLKKD